ncbi:MAG TPA: hypothetical protein VGG70_06525 [Candidatus Cybelea sp.]|jgi:hypothetical protein
MRLSMISACAFAASVLALTACASQNGVVPASQGPLAPVTTQNAADQSEAPVTSSSDASNATDAADATDTPDASGLSPKATTCAKSPPQYWWIFKGACDIFTLKSTGGSFTLVSYDNLTIKGSIGKNTAKSPAKIALADATDKNGDIGTYKKQKFPAYKARGTTVVYASANNQSSQTIKPIEQQGKTVIQYIITDSKGLPGKTCGAALLGQSGNKYQWTAFPGTSKVKGKSVTISVYAAPAGFELPPQGTPLYFAVNCF